MKAEINNIATDLALKREASFKSPPPVAKYLNDEMTTYNRSNSNWRVPQIEAIERNLLESSRFFLTEKNERKYGVKLVPPPHGTVN